MKRKTRKVLTNPRVGKLRELIAAKDIVRLLEAHNGLTGLVVETTRISKGGKDVGFDAIWESSLTDSASKGKPDISVVDMTSRMQTIEEIMDVTTKPVVVDADNGGLTEIFGFTVRSLERIGVSAVIIEDKTGRKRNSLSSADVIHKQDSIENFSDKIAFGKRSQQSDEFMIIARIESLILRKGLADALARAEAYINAGADGILIHSNARNPEEILSFCKEYKKFSDMVPLVTVPTSYNSITEPELIDAGVKVVIYANQLLRSAYPAMTSAAKLILQNGRSLETDKLCIPVSELLELIPSSTAE
ncbi:MAG TPA: phosphoenolpyruvate mutase [Candidatus Saccharimonadales bacterium]|nr:phosphoenolpyruvate mutase [Candidatus Saccharimonadales bacterium]